MKVMIEYSNYDGYEVHTSNNNIQWNVIFKNKDFEKSKIILDAFKKVGFEDITDYEGLEIHKVPKTDGGRT